MAIQLEHLDYKVCPRCKAYRRTVTQGRQHTNGQWNESIVFECGCHIEWSPNFSREHRVQQCSKHPAEVLKHEKRKLADIRIRKYIARMDVDDEFKDGLLRYI
jgi:Zn finger protein HypA/HybF involved in hydrogenase expression